MIDSESIYLDTRLLVSPRYGEVLEALLGEQAAVVILPEPYHALVQATAGHDLEASHASAALAFMREHPDRFRMLEQAEPFCGDSLMSVCIQKSGYCKVAAISNDMQLCAGIRANCSSGAAAGNLRLYRFDAGKFVLLDEHLQSVRDKFVYEARSKQLIVDAAAFTEAGFAKRLKMLGIDQALLHSSLCCYLVQDTLDRLGRTPAAQEARELVEGKVLAMVPIPAKEQDFIKGLRFMRSGNYCVLTSGKSCTQYAVKDVQSEPSPFVLFGELQEDGEVARLSPEQASSACAAPPRQAAPAEKAAEKPAGAERPHQYLKPQVEWAVGERDMTSVFKMVDQGVNMCWPVVAAVRKKLWDYAEELLDYAIKNGAELYVDGYAGLVNLLTRTKDEETAQRICRLLEKVRKVTPDRLGLAPAVDKLVLLFNETGMGKLKDALHVILKNEGVAVGADEGSGAPSGAAAHVEKGAAGTRESFAKAALDLLSLKHSGKAEAAVSEEAALLQEARELLSTHPAVAKDKAWTAANRHYFPALEFLALQVRNAAAVCALGRAYQNGIRLNQNDVQDPKGEKWIPADLELGFRYLKESADAGYPNGCLQTALCYHHGKGVEKNKTIAEKYYKRAKECHSPGIADAAAKGLLELNMGGAAPEEMSVAELAERLGVMPYNVIAALLPMGIFATPSTIVTTQQALQLMPRLRGK